MTVCLGLLQVEAGASTSSVVISSMTMSVFVLEVFKEVAQGRIVEGRRPRP